MKLNTTRFLRDFLFVNLALFLLFNFLDITLTITSLNMGFIETNPFFLSYGFYPKLGFVGLFILIGFVYREMPITPLIYINVMLIAFNILGAIVYLQSIGQILGFMDKALWVVV